MATNDNAFRSNLSYRLSMLHFQIGRRIAEVYGRQDLTTHQWKVLSVVCQLGPLPASEVESWVTLDKSAISRAVKALVDKGLVVRRLNSRDARSADLAPTRTGKQCNARIAREVSRLQADLLARLPKGDAVRLFAIFDLLERELVELAELETA